MDIDRHVRYGGRATVRTSLPTVELLTLTLAQVDLPKAMLVDVVFSIENMFADVQEFSLLVPPHLDLGSGFVRVTWGAGDVSQATVEIDPGRGWRQQFYAKSIKVEYVTVTQVAGAFVQPYPISQKEDARIQASITPAMSLQTTPSYKTVWFADMPIVTTSQKALPRFACDWQLAFGHPQTATSFTLDMLSAFGVALQRVSANASAAQWPSWSQSVPNLIPARATIASLQSWGTTPLTAPSIRCKLAL